MTDTHTYALDRAQAEVSSQLLTYAWSDLARYTGVTQWTPYPTPSPHTPPHPIGIWVQGGGMVRGPLRALTLPIPHPSIRITLAPHPRALELGLIVQQDGAGLVYLSAPHHNVFVADGVPLLIGHATPDRAGRVRRAVEALRRAGLPACAEGIVDAHARLDEATHEAQVAVSAAAERDHLTPSPLLSWADVGVLVGEVVE